MAVRREGVISACCIGSRCQIRKLERLALSPLLTRTGGISASLWSGPLDLAVLANFLNGANPPFQWS